MKATQHPSEILDDETPELSPEGGNAKSELEGLTADPVKTEALRPAVEAALKKVYDPEIPVDIWELHTFNPIRHD